jgi:hypothetical protein
MKLPLGVVIAFAAGCGGGGGEDIGGTIVIDWGPEHVVPDSGAAIEYPDAEVPGTMIVGIGDLGFGCGWADDRISNGTFVSFILEPAEQVPGSYTSLIFVTHVDDDGLHSNGSTGTLELTAVGERITGSLSMSTTDDEVGPVTSTGTFDVINCL